MDPVAIFDLAIFLRDLNSRFLFIFFSIIWCNIVNYLLYTVSNSKFWCYLAVYQWILQLLWEKFSRTNFVQFPVLSQIDRIPEFSLFHDLDMLKMKTYDDPPCPQCFPDVRILFFFFFAKIRFSKNLIFEVYCSWEIFW